MFMFYQGIIQFSAVQFDYSVQFSSVQLYSCFPKEFLSSVQFSLIIQFNSVQFNYSVQFSSV